MIDWKTRRDIEASVLGEDRKQIVVVNMAEADDEIKKLEDKLAVAQAAWGREKEKVDHLDGRIDKLEAEVKRLTEHHRNLCDIHCADCDDFECPARIKPSGDGKGGSPSTDQPIEGHREDKQPAPETPEGKKKVIIVSACRGCPYGKNNGQNIYDKRFWCAQTPGRKQGDNPDEVPSWCPLGDYNPSGERKEPPAEQ